MREVARTFAKRVPGLIHSAVWLNFLADVIFVDKLLTLITFLSETTVGTIVDIVDFFLVTVTQAIVTF